MKIAEVLAAAEADLDHVLRAVRDDIERDVARRQQTLRLLDAVLRNEPPHTEVRMERRDACVVACVSESATALTIGTATAACVERLTTALGATRATTTSPVVGLFPLDLDEQVLIRVAVETAEPPPPDLRAQLPGGTYAATLHVGSYEHIPLACHRVLRWLAERGHAARGPILEIYLTNPGDTAPADYVTRVLVAMEDSPDDP